MATQLVPGHSNLRVTKPTQGLMQMMTCKRVLLQARCLLQMTLNKRATMAAHALFYTSDHKQDLLLSSVQL